MSRQRVNSTHFTGVHDAVKNEKRWGWVTKSPNGNEIGEAGQNYRNLEDAVNGYFSKEGLPQWNRDDPFPDGYQVEKTGPDSFVIHKLEVKGK